MAGGLQNQSKIDHDMCLEREGRKEGRREDLRLHLQRRNEGLLSMYMPHSKLKIGVEDAIKELRFEQSIMLRPGMILRGRETPRHDSWKSS